MRVSWLIVLLALLVSVAHSKPRYSSANTGTGASASTAAAGGHSGSSSTAASDSDASGVKKGERDLLEDMLRESDVLNLLEQEQKKHEKRLKELQNRLERELQQVQDHFESVMVKLKKTEEQLETNLRNVEKSIVQQVKSSNERSENVSNSWRWPFFILIIMLAGLGGFFGNLYRKATKNMRML